MTLTTSGWPDLYLVNNVSDNVLYINSGDGTFDEVSHLAHVADYKFINIPANQNLEIIEKSNTLKKILRPS